ncbi:AAA family ATPase [Francisella philomiragia]|uniref:AAA family ATPase n=1 Tax=Francisella philomiragia TaxID=28110 RepID=A0ABS1GEI1_9GAMM|nr:AAA family ATPase [Francisella philomiragia]MBK2259561.1 AAA family ATPase [Francisella philomiragia]MBK2303253.1 AAA family ATPase [Francisella philomiragia]
MIIGLYLRHIKAYKGINFIPIGHKHRFISYVGENGIGKSSILEALDSFFNIKKYTLNKDAIEDGISIPNNPYILPIFLIEKTKITQNKKEFNILSDFFWSVDKDSMGTNSKMKEFFDIRESISNRKDTHYLLAIGETINLKGTSKISFGGFHKNKNFLEAILDTKISDIEDAVQDLDILVDKAIWKKILQYLKELYAYVYFPVELEIESFTKIETVEMQKVFDKNLKNEINEALSNVKFTGTDGINTKLDSFVDNIETKLEKKYCYDTGVQRGNTVTQTDITEKIIEAYFQKRVLYKDKKRVSELSAGEKRQALINLVYAFLIKSERSRNVIIAIDEPENSLHTSLCYDQFEKLYEISNSNQVLVTTHWYGFLPTISKGFSHFINIINDSLNFETYDLYDYKARIKHDIKSTNSTKPYDMSLKSTNDLVQSIFYSLIKDKPYNWLIVEGVSEKKYFDFFFEKEISEKKLRILCLGGNAKVSELYEYLELPIKNEKNNLKGKVYCLIDTDKKEHKKYITSDYGNLKIRRLSNNDNNIETSLLALNHSDNSICEIEQSLHPIIFREVMSELDVNDEYKVKSIEDENGNTHFIKNFRNLDIHKFFEENSGENKVIFAEKYVDIMSQKDAPNQYIPKWINEIRGYFNNK